MNTMDMDPPVRRQRSAARLNIAVRWTALALLLCAVCSSQQHGATARSPELDSPETVTTHYISVPAAAFRPKNFYFYYDYLNFGETLINTFEYESIYSDYYASLQMPEGATITKLTFDYRDDDPDGESRLYLVGTLLSEATLPSSFLIATLNSVTDSSSTETDPGFSYTVTNDTVGYYLQFSTNFNGAELHRVLVTYTLPEAAIPLPYDLNIAPAGFVPYADDLPLFFMGGIVDNRGTVATAHIQAPVFLPQGMEVQDAKFYYYDGSSSQNVEAHLHRTDLKGSWDPALAMADLYSSGNAGWGAAAAPVARYEKIDNSNNAYWVYYQLPPKSTEFIDLQGRFFKITFEPDGSYLPIRSISVPAAAFTPQVDGQEYENHGEFLKSFIAYPGNYQYVAPIYLPDGKFIRRVKFYYGVTGSPIYQTLMRLRIKSSVTNITEDLVSFTTSGTGWTYKDSGLLNGLQVDNEHNQYWIDWRTGSNYTNENIVLPTGVVIEVADGNTLLFLPVARK